MLCRTQSGGASAAQHERAEQLAALQQQVRTLHQLAAGSRSVSAAWRSCSQQLPDKVRGMQAVLSAGRAPAAGQPPGRAAAVINLVDSQEEATAAAEASGWHATSQAAWPPRPAHAPVPTAGQGQPRHPKGAAASDSGQRQPDEPAPRRQRADEHGASTSAAPAAAPAAGPAAAASSKLALLAGRVRSTTAHQQRSQHQLTRLHSAQWPPAADAPVNGRCVLIQQHVWFTGMVMSASLPA